jgi:hypothetical protein
MVGMPAVAISAVFLRAGRSPSACGPWADEQPPTPATTAPMSTTLNPLAANLAYVRRGSDRHPVRPKPTHRILMVASATEPLRAQRVNLTHHLRRRSPSRGRRRRPWTVLDQRHDGLDDILGTSPRDRFSGSLASRSRGRVGDDPIVRLRRR